MKLLNLIFIMIFLPTLPSAGSFRIVFHSHFYHETNDEQQNDKMMNSELEKLRLETTWKNIGFLDSGARSPNSREPRYPRILIFFRSAEGACFKSMLTADPSLGIPIVGTVWRSLEWWIVDLDLDLVHCSLAKDRLQVRFKNHFYICVLERFFF